MRIALLNPWVNAAENQAYSSLAEGARRIGLELVGCSNPDQVDHSGAEFVISVASSVPKVSDIPSYLTVHEPPSRFLNSKFYLHNFLSYDGYLTISDSLQTFVREMTAGTGRFDEPGFYFNTPQKLDARTDFHELVKDEALRIVYCGTNWDQRLPQLFKHLDNTGLLSIHGPAHSWESRGLQSYKGPLPFDGVSPQMAYSQAGLGLALLSAEHLRWDVISNRIFEISSVGAVSLCPDMPWVRKWFGDSVFYFDSGHSARGMTERILETYDFCRQNPEKAQQMGAQARAIFEENFSSERVLSNAVAYHERKQRETAAKRRKLGEPPLISVIVRCGGRRLNSVRTCVESIRRQTFGRVHLIFVRYKHLDLQDLVQPDGAVVSSEVRDVPDGNRAVTLFTGMAAARESNAEYFAVLDDDDYWFSNHFETLFEAGRAVNPKFDVAFSGSIAVTEKGHEIETKLFWRRNIYSFGYRDKIRSLLDVTGSFTSNCFVARVEVLPEDLAPPLMETAEDSLMVALVCFRNRPTFSYRATALFSRHSEEQSNFEQHPRRKQDELTVYMRAGMARAPRWMDFGATSELTEQWARSNLQSTEQVQGQRSIPPDDAQCMESNFLLNTTTYPEWKDIGASSIYKDDQLSVHTSAQAWAYAAEVPLKLSDLGSDRFDIWVYLLAHVDRGVCSVSLWDSQRDTLIQERLLETQPRAQEIYFSVPREHDFDSLMIRNGSMDVKSQIRVLKANILIAEREDRD